MRRAVRFVVRMDDPARGKIDDGVGNVAFAIISGGHDHVHAARAFVAIGIAGFTIRKAGIKVQLRCAE